MTQEQKNKKRREGKKIEGSKEGTSGSKMKAKGEALTKEMDGLIDEIDKVLAENEFEAKDYVQKGGE